MIQPNELRIGNYVELYNKIERVTGIDIKHTNDKNYYISFQEKYNNCFWIDQINPIPLTEDWLLKFGFNKRQDENVFDIKYLSAFLLIDAVCIKTYDSYNEVDSSLCLIKYVHQLQNLYFALTQTELTLS